MLFTHKSALDLPTAPGTFKNLAGTLALSNGTTYKADAFTCILVS